MINDDKDILKIMRDYDPALPDNVHFMNTLKSRMDAIDMCREELEVMRSRSRLAVIIACAVGFISGVICTLLFPVLLHVAGHLIELIHLPADGVREMIVVYACIAAVVLISSLTTYQGILYALPYRKNED